MPCINPTGEGPAITLSIAPSDRPFIHRVLLAAADGITDELERFPEQLREPASRLLAERSAYEQLTAALNGKAISSEQVICSALLTLARSIDAENAYERVVAEHDALASLLRQLCWAVI